MSDARGLAEYQVGELAVEAAARAVPVCQGRVLLEVAEGGSPVGEWLTAFRAARRRALPVCAQAQRCAAVNKYMAKLAGGALRRQCLWIGWCFQFDHRCAAKETDVLQELLSGREICRAVDDPGRTSAHLRARLGQPCCAHRVVIPGRQR